MPSLRWLHKSDHSYPQQSVQITPKTPSQYTSVRDLRLVGDQSSSGSSLMDDSERCRRLGLGLRRWGNFDDVGLGEGEALSSLRADVDDDGEDGEELYMIYGSLSS